jgi:hypothetical protein
MGATSGRPSAVIRLSGCAHRVRTRSAPSAPVFMGLSADLRTPILLLPVETLCACPPDVISTRKDPNRGGRVVLPSAWREAQGAKSLPPGRWSWCRGNGAAPSGKTSGADGSCPALRFGVAERAGLVGLNGRGGGAQLLGGKSLPADGDQLGGGCGETSDASSRWPWLRSEGRRGEPARVGAPGPRLRSPARPLL